MFRLKVILTLFLLALGAANSFFVSSFGLQAPGYAVIAAGLFVVRGIPFDHPRVSVVLFNRFHDLFIGALVFAAGWFGLVENLQGKTREQLARMVAAGESIASLGEIDVAFVIVVTAVIVFLVGFFVVVFHLCKEYRNSAC